MAYDPSNIFARMLRGEIPFNKLHENEHALAFHDIYPKAPVHVLAIPKGSYTDSSDFFKQASEQEITGYYKLIADVVDQLNLQTTGYRLISNCGVDAGQEVPHFHTHIVGGRLLGPILKGE